MELESQFRSWLKTQLIIKSWSVTNVESSTKNGIPDMHLCREGKTAWLELKRAIVDPCPLLRKEQRIWGLKYATHGGKAFVVHHIEDISLCRIYRHPIINIEMAGKYLRVLDPPVFECHLKELTDALWLLIK